LSFVQSAANLQQIPSSVVASTQVRSFGQGTPSLKTALPAYNANGATL
jgi:hypothetical protein